MDEALACFILIWYGMVRFIGIGEAKIVFKLANIPGITAEQMEWSAERLLEELGVLCVGCLGERGAMFDEHGNKRDGGKAACMLVADYLEVTERKELKQLLEFVDQFDRRGHGEENKVLQDKCGPISARLTNYDIRAVMRAKHRNGEADEQRMQWTLEVIQNLVYQKRRTRLMEKNIQSFSRTEHIRVSGKKMQVWLIHTDEHDVPSVAFRNGASVAIIRRDDNHTSIVPNQRSGFDMQPVARAIRQLEAEKLEIEVGDDSLDGEHSRAVPNWDFNPSGGGIFNTDEQKVLTVAPTVLSDDELLDLVIQNLRFKP
jgi:hypothetical protein